MDTLKRPVTGLRELSLFTGIGGSLLAGHRLGWRTVCAVECEPYAVAQLCARQNDGSVPPFPIWTDVSTFDGREWRGRVDLVSGGFPCQDISCAGKRAGIDGAKSGLWREMARIIAEVRPRHVVMENSPLMVSATKIRGRLTEVVDTLFGTQRLCGEIAVSPQLPPALLVLAELAKMGFDAEYVTLSAADVGAPHQRERFWMLASLDDAVGD